MAILKTEERLSELEITLQDFIRHTNRSFTQLNYAIIDFKNETTDFRERSEKSMAEFKEEMRVGREESKKEMHSFIERSEKSMTEFKEEMRVGREESKKEMHSFIERSEKSMTEFKEEMRVGRQASEKSMTEFKEEMRVGRQASEKSMTEFKEEMRTDRVDLNKKWGELANKMGTLVEDIVVPNIIPLAEKYFGVQQEPEDFMVRRRKKHSKDKSLRREFDVIAVYEDMIFLNETKATARQAYLDQFVESIPAFFEFFPEYSGRKIVPIFASLYVNEDTVKYATQKGIYVLATKGDTMDILNFEAVGGI